MCITFLFFFSSRRRHTSCALVTGVQTCALPIYTQFYADHEGKSAFPVDSAYDVLTFGQTLDSQVTLPQALSALASASNGQAADVLRSAERRVGKEWVSTCRSRWSPDH